jgi:TPP-dependent trihydroxycyclohexane-1,2-dione (THcHDO) dehydratase
MTVSTVRLTVAQALVRFLVNQHSERDGVRHVRAEPRARTRLVRKES